MFVTFVGWQRCLWLIYIPEYTAQLQGIDSGHFKLLTSKAFVSWGDWLLSLLSLQLRNLTPQLTKRRNVETSRVYTLPCCAFCSFNLLPFKMILFVYIVLHHICTCPLFLFATPHWACKCSAFILCIEDKEKGGSDEHKELINSLSLSGSHERHVDGSIRGNLHYYRPLLRCILAMQGHCLLLRVWIVQ